jgi:uncharacterized protein YndB with AHSA1/START domain
MQTVERQLTLPTSLDEAWELLTRPEDLAGWLGREVVLDPTPGAAGLVVDHDGTQRHLVVERVDATGDEARRLAWRWWVDGEGDGEPVTSRVEVTLDRALDGTVLTVTEELEVPATAHASARAAVTASSAAWSHRLLHLESLLLVAAAVRG